MRLDAGTGFLLAWRVGKRLPEPVLRAAAHVAADVASTLRPGGVRQLEANLRRVRPAAGRRELRRLVRQGMRRYLQYYAEAFVLARLTPTQLDARVRVSTFGPVADAAANGAAVVLALAHQGNWDLAGAWATRHLMPVVTVAERLRPPEVFEEFLRLREGIGLRIVPLDDGGEVFRELVRTVRGGNVLLPLLADRDLTARGVEVELFGERARVAAGPAALAVTAGAPLVPVTIQHERLHGAARRAAGSRWGICICFHDAVAVPAGVPRPEQVRVATQRWVDTLATSVAADPTHWHMLQKVFVADLDAARYARTVAAQEAS